MTGCTGEASRIGRWWGLKGKDQLGKWREKGPAKSRNRTETTARKEMGVEKGRGGKLTGCSTTTLLAPAVEASIGASFAGSTLTSSPFIFPFQTHTAFFPSKDHFLKIDFPPEREKFCRNGSSRGSKGCFFLGGGLGGISETQSVGVVRLTVRMGKVSQAKKGKGDEGYISPPAASSRPGSPPPSLQ